MQEVPMSVQIQPQIDADRRDAFVGRLFGSGIAAADYATIYIGDRLGLYRALADRGALTEDELAAAAGIHRRYAREWLEQQAVTEILEVDDPGAPAEERRYSLPPEYAEVLLDQTSLYHLGPLPRIFSSFGSVLPQLLDAFRTGGGVAYVDYGADMREAQAALNRPQFEQLLGTRWLPSIPDVHERLTSAQPARVADVACGAGWSSVAIARAYPGVHVDG